MSLYSFITVKCRSLSSVVFALFCSRNIDIWNSLPEHLVKCGTVQTFTRHLDRIDLSKFITYQQGACAACICCCILLFSFFSICFLFCGKVSLSFYDISCPVANQLYCFCLCYYVLWFPANKFDLI